MLCSIYSKTKKIPPDIWNVIKKNSTPSQNEILEYDFNKMANLCDETIMKKGYGYFAKFNGIVYVVSCFHIIGLANMEIYAVLTKNSKRMKIMLSIVSVLQEFDLVVMKIADNTKQRAFDIMFDVPDSFESSIYISEIQKSLNDLTLLCNEKNAIKISGAEISNSHLKSIIIPKIPLIRYTCSIEDDDELDGISGSLLSIDTKIVGMTISYSNKKIEAIPTVLINSLVKVMIYNPEKQLSGFFFESSIVDVSNNFEKKTCHYIAHANDVQYGNFKLKSGDIIVNINDAEINDDGTIYNQYVGYNIDLDSHMMLCDYFNGTLKIKIMRKKTNKYRDMVKEISGIPLSDIHSVKILNTNQYIYWNGFIFTELSEELIFTLNCMGLELSGEIFEKYYLIKSVNRNKKIVVLIDIDYGFLNTMSQEYSDHWRNAGGPFIKTKTGYKLLIIDKIGNNKISNLSELKINLTEKSKLTFENYTSFEFS